ncbi:MAG: hypothetical protein JNJ91_05165 [Flavobacteriales bacterium]|nr:hypothetical protein [Flavobacteriales bacterium]
MADVRIKVDHDQLGILIAVMEEALQDKVRGEALNMVWSIIERLVERLRVRRAARRLEYQLILTVYQALALRRMAIAGQEFMTDQRHVNELRMVLMVLDPKLTQYTN